MYNKSAEYYDDIYASFKNYAEDSKKIIALIQKHVPHCKNILDVACGTGEHAKFLKGKYQIDGIDLNPAFLKIAKQKNPKGHYSRHDMTHFNLDKKYDVILCLFSAIGYVKTLANLQKAIACFAKHLNAGGMILIEPWLTPQTIQDGKTHIAALDKEQQYQIARVALTKVRGNLSIVKFHYLLAKNKKVKFFTETHHLGLFTEKQITRALQHAGLRVTYDKKGLTTRGLYLAKNV